MEVRAGDYILVTSETSGESGLFIISSIMSDSQLMIHPPDDESFESVLSLIDDRWYVEGSDETYLVSSADDEESYELDIVDDSTIEESTVNLAPDDQVYGSGCLKDIPRRSHEDRHISGLLNNSVQVYAVFDGHGGNYVSETLKNEFAPVLAQALLNVNLDSLIEVKGAVQQALEEFDYEHFAKIKVDNWPFPRRHSKMSQEEKQTITNLEHDPGSTLTMALVTDNYIYLINLGDSRTILYNRATAQVISDTIDHDVSRESARISELDGLIFRGRLMRDNDDGTVITISVGRGMGDVLFKISKAGVYSPEGLISTKAEINQIPRFDNQSLILMSDGLLERSPNKTSQNFLTHILQGSQGSPGSGGSPNSPDTGDDRCERAIEFALTNRSTDDLTIMIVDL